MPRRRRGVALFRLPAWNRLHRLRLPPPATLPALATLAALAAPSAVAHHAAGRATAERATAIARAATRAPHLLRPSRVCQRAADRSHVRQLV